MAWEYNVCENPRTGDRYIFVGGTVGPFGNGWVKLKPRKEPSQASKDYYNNLKVKADKFLDNFKDKHGEDKNTILNTLHDSIYVDEQRKRRVANRKRFQAEFGGATPVQDFSDLTRILRDFIKNQIDEVESNHTKIEPYQDLSLTAGYKSLTFRGNGGKLMTPANIDSERMVPDPTPEIAIPHIYVYLDVSGSFDPKKQLTFAKSVLGALDKYTKANKKTGRRPELSIEYYYFASSVNTEATLCGGGTNIENVMNHIKDREKEHPDSLINVLIVSDGQYGWTNEMMSVSGGVFFYLKRGSDGVTTSRTFVTKPNGEKSCIITGEKVYFCVDDSAISAKIGALSSEEVDSDIDPEEIEEENEEDLVDVWEEEDEE